MTREKDRPYCCDGFCKEGRLCPLRKAKKLTRFAFTCFLGVLGLYLALLVYLLGDDLTALLN